jgi:hypothetical protein
MLSFGPPQNAARAPERRTPGFFEITLFFSDEACQSSGRDEAREQTPGPLRIIASDLYTGSTSPQDEQAA